MPEPSRAEKIRFARSLWRAMDELDRMETPCWDCSNWGPFGPGKLRGGTFEGGPKGCIARTLHNKTGACVNCGHINTKRQESALKKRKEKNTIAILELGKRHA